jgi:hypothetical protein
MSRTYSLLLLCLVAVMPVSVSAQEPVKLAVMTLEDRSGELDLKLVDDLTDYLRTQIARRGTFIVIDKSRQAAALKKIITGAKKESYKQCYDENCQIPLGKALSADTVLRVKLTRIGSTFHLSAEMVDLAKEAVDPGAAASVEIAASPKKGLADRLLAGIREIARQIAGEMPGGAGETINIGSDTSYGVTAEGGKGAKSGDGIVKFVSNPSGAIVEVNGRRLPKTTPVQEFLQLGEHSVKVIGPEGYEIFKQKVTLEAGQIVKVTLRPVTGTAIIRPRDTNGNLLTGVAVFLDDEEIAKAPVRINGILAGKRSFRFALQGMRPVSKTVSITESRALDVDVTLSPEEGILRLENLTIQGRKYEQTGVSGQVLVNDTVIGNTPIQHSLKPGEYRVTLKHSMGKTRKYTVTIQDGQTETIKPELEANNSADWSNFVKQKQTAHRNGIFYWMSFASTAPGRFHMVNYKTDEFGITKGWAIRTGQLLTYGIGFEYDYFSLRAFDALIDVGSFKLPNTDKNALGVSVGTNPTVEMVVRFHPTFPLKIVADAEVYYAWSGEQAEVDVRFMQWRAGGHVMWEIFKDYMMGHPHFEIGLGGWYHGISGKVGPDGALDDKVIRFTAADVLAGGKLSFVIPTGERNGIFLGVGGYASRKGEIAVTWMLDWRGILKGK